MSEDLGQHRVVLIRGRGLMIFVEDRFPRQFQVGQGVVVNGKQYKVTGIEGSGALVFPPKEDVGVGLFLKEVESRS